MNRPTLHRILVILACIGMLSMPARAETDLVEAAAAVGITPESVVLADLHTSTTAIFSRFATATELLTSIAVAEQALDAASAQVSELAAQLARTSGDLDLIARYENALANLEGIRVQIEDLREDLLEHLTDGLPAAKVDVLRAWRESTQYRVAPEFRVLDLTAEQWKAVEGALRAERRANRRGEQLAMVHADLLNDIRGNVNVTAAAQRLDQYLQATCQVFITYRGT